MAESQEKRESLESVNESVETTASMDYISRKHKYVVFNKYSTDRVIDDVKEVLEEDPDYLLQQEKDFIQNFINIFGSSRTHTNYNVEPEEYMEIISSSIGAMRSRMNAERDIIIDEEDDAAEDLQYLFFKISDLLRDIQEDIMENYETYSDNPREFFNNKEKVLAVSKFLAKAYYYEFEYLRDNDIEVMEIRSTIASVNDERNIHA